MAAVVIQDGFLGAHTVRGLLEYASRNESSFRPSTVGSQREIDETFRSSRLLHDLGHFRGLIEARVHGWLPLALPQLGLPLFAVHDIEMQLVAHGDGAFYAPHVDVNAGEQRRPGDPDRLVTVVYYFHREPAVFEGGSLRIHPLPTPSGTEPAFDVAPAQDRAVAFPSWLPHEVLPVRSVSRRFIDSRFAINCWVLRA